MPLTTAHAAAAWPMRRAWPALPLAPLVIGTLSPDFEYFYRLAPTGRTFHSLPGIFVFCLPVSLLVVALFDRLIRPAIARRMPPAIARTIARSRAPVGAVAVAIVLGAATHVGWDGFTHADDWGVRLLPALREGGLETRSGLLAWYKLLQHGSTIAGSAVVALWAWRWWSSLPAAVRLDVRRHSGPILRAIVVVAATAAAGGVANGAVALGGGWAFVLGRAAVGAMVGVVLAATGIALADRRWRVR